MLLRHDEVVPAFGYSAGRACHREPPQSSLFESSDSLLQPCVARAAAAEASAIARGVRATVVIIAHNEAGCALRRTLLAVGRNTPRDLLAEVLVLDDASAPRAEAAVAAAAATAGSPLPSSLPVRWVRSDVRLGVVRARLAAARAAAAESSVLAFLDAHCEPQTLWMPPLLAHLEARPKAVALPVLEGLDRRTWALSRQRLHEPQHPPRGIFVGWNLTFGWAPLSARQREERRAAAPDGALSPLMAPVMAGGVFAIGREWFFESGGYDDGLEVWGAENVEMSVRMWTCGGELATLPCSRVAHTFRESQPFSWPSGNGALTVLRNVRRVAAVWMDDVDQIVRSGRADGKGDGGAAGRLVTKQLEADRPRLDKRRELRRRLGCKPFRWYLEHVFPDHPPLPEGFRWREPERAET